MCCVVIIILNHYLIDSYLIDIIFVFKGAVSYYTHMLLRITNLKALGQRFQV